MRCWWSQSYSGIQFPIVWWWVQLFGTLLCSWLTTHQSLHGIIPGTEAVFEYPEDNDIMELRNTQAKPHTHTREGPLLWLLLSSTFVPQTWYRTLMVFIEKIHFSFASARETRDSWDTRQTCRGNGSFPSFDGNILQLEMYLHSTYYTVKHLKTRSLGHKDESTMGAERLSKRLQQHQQSRLTHRSCLAALGMMLLPYLILFHVCYQTRSRTWNGLFRVCRCVHLDLTCWWLVCHVVIMTSAFSPDDDTSVVDEKGHREFKGFHSWTCFQMMSFQVVHVQI